MSVTGANPGPRLVVNGPPTTVESLANRLWDLPNLGSICGSLILRDERQAAVYDYPDDVLTVDHDLTQAYRLTLGRMAHLGMISGRAVPARWIALATP